MGTHVMTLDNGEARPYAYCSTCGWAQTYSTDAEARSASESHEHNDLGDTRYDADGRSITPED